VEEVDMAVVIDFADGTALVISWAMDGFAEGIDVEAGPADAFPLNADRESEYVVSDTGPWSELRGRVLDGVSAAWQLRSEYAPETAWAIRFSFAGGRAVVIALGQVRDDHVQYQPDSLVVFFEEDAAAAYRCEYESHGGAVPSSWQSVAS
jgi:hypothetical protein